MIMGIDRSGVVVPFRLVTNGQAPISQTEF
jgi:hypothetical protein